MSGLEERRMVVLSTAHLQRSTAEAAEAADAGEYPIDSVAYGYLFCVSGYPYACADDDPPELKECADTVGALLFGGRPFEGSFYILFDCDGYVLPTLKTYEW